MKRKNKITLALLIGSYLLSPLQVLALTKNETIYSNLDWNGTPSKTTVSNHLTFIGTDSIEDETELKDILNITGKETFKLNGNLLTWENQNKDIFYEGKTDKNLPIETTIKYYLNDEEKNVEDILGKDGKIEVKILFKNKDLQEVNVSGKKTSLYTPFVTTVGTILNSEYNKNISISNGKVVSTGTRSTIVGIASPGLYDSLKLDEFKSLDEIVIRYETTKFELNNIYIVSSPKLLEETDLNVFHKMDDLYKNVSDLQKNMNILENGIKELANGTSSLVTGSKEMMNSLKQASLALEELKKGSSSLDNGLMQILSSLNNAKKELESLNVNSSVSSLSTLKEQNSFAIKTLISKTGMSEEKLASIYTSYNLKDYKGEDEKLIDLKNCYELVTLLKANNTAITKTGESMSTLVTKLNTLIRSLEDALSKTEQGAKQLTNGTLKLKTGIDKIYAGSKTLNQGIITLQNGANSLCKGASTFNKEGINKLNHYAYTLKNYSDKAEALMNLSKNYQGFSSNNANQTTFISMVKSAKITYSR